MAGAFERYTLQTPENIEVHFELAGPGSRFCALIIDWLLMGLFILALVLLALLATSSFAGVDMDDMGPWIAAAAIVVVFLAQSGYYIFFEWIMGGQTPGKRSMKLRVIHDDGTPMTLRDNLVRNLLRIVDALPGLYAVGGIATLLNAQHQRLGDLAAGTIVVKEAELDYRARSDRKYQMASAIAEEQIGAELTPQERQVVRSFLERRDELLPQARRDLALRIAKPLAQKYGRDLREPEVLLETLLLSQQPPPQEPDAPASSSGASP